MRLENAVRVMEYVGNKWGITVGICYFERWLDKKYTGALWPRYLFKKVNK